MLPQDDSWRLTAFAAMSAQAGFMLAAIALLHSVKAKAESDKLTVDLAKVVRQIPMFEVVNSSAWNGLVGTVTSSMWWWMISAATALACFLAGWRPFEMMFVTTACLALGYGLNAIMWMTVAARWLRNDLE